MLRMNVRDVFGLFSVFWLLLFPIRSHNHGPSRSAWMRGIWRYQPSAWANDNAAACVPCVCIEIPRILGSTHSCVIIQSTKNIDANIKRVTTMPRAPASMLVYGRPCLSQF